MIDDVHAMTSIACILDFSCGGDGIVVDDNTTWNEEFAHLGSTIGLTIKMNDGASSDRTDCNSRGHL
jgi:hypothetical protein